MRARTLLAFVLLAFVAVSGLACTNFENPTTVIDLRMLAVQVEPSEIILDADLSNPLMPIVDPASNPVLTVTPLIADPKGNGRDVFYSIKFCPNDPFAAAPPGGGQGGGAFPSGGARTTVGSALCDENDPNTWTAPGGSVAAGMPFMVPVGVDQLTAAFMADIFPDQYGKLHGGFDLGMPLTLDITVDAGTEQIRGIKRVLYWAQRIDDRQMPNQIPTIDTLDTFYERDDTTFDPVDDPMVIPDGAPMPFVIERPGVASIWIRPSKGNAESYETTVIDPDTHQAVPFTVARETLRYRFFATAGTFSPAITSSEPDTGFVATGPIHIESEYQLPSDTSDLPVDEMGRPVVTIWVVVRDDRGGESWAERKLALTP